MRNIRAPGQCRCKAELLRAQNISLHTPYFITLYIYFIILLIHINIFCLYCQAKYICILRVIFPYNNTISVDYNTETPKTLFFWLHENEKYEE